MKPYKPYKPSSWESRIDKAIGLVAPGYHLKRIVSRERANYFRYLAALSNSGRRNTNQSQIGETMRGAREKLQVMWNAINMVDNSGLCSSLLWKFQMYICGTLRWQSRCGDKAIATEYEDYMRLKLGRALDYTGRFSLRTQSMLDIKGIALKGDIGTNIVRDGKDLFLQGIEAERIGDPTNYSISNNYVRGLRLDDAGIIVAVDVFYRDRMSSIFQFDQTIPMRDNRGFPRFLFLVNPISYDDYRGVSMFKTAIDNATYIDNMRQQELQALMWAASQSGVYHTNSGTLPDALPFDRINPMQDESGNAIERYEVRPNTVTALGVGENVSMFQHDRPSPNVLGMVKDTIRDIAVGFGVSFEFAWDMSGLSGPAVRGVSAQDARAFEVWQELLKEGKLDPVAGLILGNGIANGDIPYHPNWQSWQWFFPAKSTIDAGRESAANIDEISFGINTGARVAADDGQDIDEIQEQVGKETHGRIETAMDVAKQLSKGGEEISWREVYNYMYPPRKGAAAIPLGIPKGPPKEDAPGVTTEGVDIGEGNGNGSGRRNGETIELRRTKDGVQLFFRPDQARDDKGKFADEGKGTLLGEHRATIEPPAREAEEFFSPNEGEMNFEQALSALHSENQVRARQIADYVDQAVGLAGRSEDGIGDWNDGAENSVLHEIDNAKDFSTIRYSAALKGKALNQKAVLAFQVDASGKAAIHRVTVPTSDLDQLRTRLNDAGIQHRTLLPHGSRTDIVIYDPDNSQAENLLKVADTYDKQAQVKTIQGSGEFVGEADTRESAQANYDKIISEYEQSHRKRHATV